MALEHELCEGFPYTGADQDGDFNDMKIAL